MKRKSKKHISPLSSKWLSLSRHNGIMVEVCKLNLFSSFLNSEIIHTPKMEKLMHIRSVVGVSHPKRQEKKISLLSGFFNSTGSSNPILYDVGSTLDGRDWSLESSKKECVDMGEFTRYRGVHGPKKVVVPCPVWPLVVPLYLSNSVISERWRWVLERERKMNRKNKIRQTRDYKYKFKYT